MVKAAKEAVIEVKPLNLVMIRLGERIQLIGIQVATDIPDVMCFTQMLNIMGNRPMKLDSDGLLSDLTEAEKATAPTLMDLSRRNVPIMNLPDESIMSSVSITDALEKVWTFPMIMINNTLPVTEESIIGRFYKVTINELVNNREVSRRLFHYSDLSNDVARAIYDEELAKKIFKRI